jgi:two-component system copper resistance phosphate regulon response regulator CusR
MRILLVEDERHNASYLRKGLADNGFAVDIAQQGQIGLDLARKTDYDLLVLNAMLGLPVFLELRRSGKQTPVLFLSGDTARAPRVGLPQSITTAQPFAFSEFLTRVRSVVNCAHAEPNGKLAIVDLELDLVKHRVLRAGKRMDLTPKEFLLLSLLVRHSGEVQSRAVIADQVWGINFDSKTNFVDVHIRRLRAKVDDPFETKLIHTVRGSGYVLEPRS